MNIKVCLCYSLIYIFECQFKGDIIPGPEVPKGYFKNWRVDTHIGDITKKANEWLISSSTRKPMVDGK